jgi:uncharacterized protein
VSRILALADEYDGRIHGSETLARMAPDLVLGCGDLPFDYLEDVVTVANVPLLYVPGNHDPELGRSGAALGSILFGVPGVAVESRDGTSAGPQGCVNIDGRVQTVGGLRVGGLGGSVRYREGPNQYTQREMRRRAGRLARRARRGLDLLVTHAPPLDLGDEEDPPHRGFEAFHGLVARTRPRVLVHGHIHPYGRARPDRRLGQTLVVNAIPYRLLELPG